jgi:two-component system NtrC family sensor kinase
LKAQYSEAIWFNKAIKKEFYISDVFLGLRGLPHFIASVRVNHRGKPWLLRATIDFMKFNKVVENLRVGKTGLAFIVNREGQFQTAPPQNIADKKFNMDIIKSNNDEIEINESLNFKIYQGIIYVSAFLKNGDWIMVYRQELDDALSDFKKTQNVAVLIIILGALVIMAMAVILSGISVSRIEEADREKEMMNQQMIETGKLASVGELAAGIAHEINNPVAIMVEEAGWMQDLLEDDGTNDSENSKEFARSLKQIQTQGQRCKEITHKLLSFARKTDSRIHDIQVNELINEVIELSGQRAKYASVNVTTNLEENLPLIRISQTEFQQVLLNLINNAVDAMEKTGGTIAISSYIEDDDIIITVSDTGPGIPKANLSRIFDPFYTTKPVGKGTGLGLSICYGIIKKLGGDLNVHSVLKEGTKFKIRIPVIGKSNDEKLKKNPKK